MLLILLIVSVGYAIYLFRQASRAEAELKRLKDATPVVAPARISDPGPVAALAGDVDAPALTDVRSSRDRMSQVPRSREDGSKPHGSVDRETMLRFDYVDSDGICTTREIVNWLDTRIYVRGICTMRHETRTFRKDRIERWSAGQNSLRYGALPFALDESEEQDEDELPDTVCFTGASVGRKRAEWVAEARASGWMTTDSASRALILVAADPTGTSSKLVDARRADVAILSYEQWSRVVLTPVGPAR